MLKPKVIFAAFLFLFSIFALYLWINSLEAPSHTHSEDEGSQDRTAQIENIKKSITELEKRLETNPDDFNILMALGHAYLELQNFKEAQKYFGKAAQINPESAEAQTDLALTLSKNNSVKDALAILEKVTKTFPDYGDGWLQLAVIYRFSLKDNEKALYNFQKFMEVEKQSELIPRVKEEIKKIKAEMNIR
ncbi:MAG: tetratricopeptide repeat protein [Calditrichaeota bacterium]|nr:tetratricopeptide repeat protein [Calditrichota bacterium]